MALTDQVAIAQHRKLGNPATFPFWKGPSVSGWVFNVSPEATDFEIQTSNATSTVVRVGEVMGVKDITTLSIKTTVPGCAVAYVLYYSGPALTEVTK
jgi:hypothetical protein